MLCLQAYLSGLVQGVGMRYYVRTLARKLGLTGYVKNLPNGQVEIIAQGKKKNWKNYFTTCEIVKLEL